MEETVRMLLISTQGYYDVVVPDFERREFKKTGERVPAGRVVPFGFIFQHAYQESLFEEKNIGKSEEDLDKHVFSETLKKLQERIHVTGADYVLIERMCVQNKFSPGILQFEIPRCQLMKKISYQHVPAPVYGGASGRR